VRVFVVQYKVSDFAVFVVQLFLGRVIAITRALSLSALSRCRSLTLSHDIERWREIEVDARDHV